MRLRFVIAGVGAVVLAMTAGLVFASGIQEPDNPFCFWPTPAPTGETFLSPIEVPEPPTGWFELCAAHCYDDPVYTDPLGIPTLLIPTVSITGTPTITATPTITVTPTPTATPTITAGLNVYAGSVNCENGGTGTPILSGAGCVTFNAVETSGETETRWTACYTSEMTATVQSYLWRSNGYASSCHQFYGWGAYSSGTPERWGVCAGGLDYPATQTVVDRPWHLLYGGYGWTGSSWRWYRGGNSGVSRGITSTVCFGGAVPVTPTPTPTPSPTLTPTPTPTPITATIPISCMVEWNDENWPGYGIDEPTPWDDIGTEEGECRVIVPGGDVGTWFTIPGFEVCVTYVDVPTLKSFFPFLPDVSLLAILAIVPGLWLAAQLWKQFGG